MNPIECKCGKVFVPKQIYNAIEKDNTINIERNIGFRNLYYCICPECCRILDIQNYEK